MLNRTVVFVCAIFGWSLAAASPPPSYDAAMEEARAAFETGDWQALSDSLDAAQLHRPYSLYVTKNRILARELNGDRAGALALAESLAERGLSMTLSGHPALEALTSDAAFAPIAERMTENLKPVGASKTVTTAPDDDLLPEAIVIDSAGNLWVGSVRRGAIAPVDQEGARALAAPGGVFDIEIRGETLWAAVNNQLAYEKAGDSPALAAVMAFNPATGALKRDIRLGGEDALIGDIEIASAGTIYASDSIAPRIFRVALGEEATKIFANPRYANLQGIALDEEHDRLFIADYLTGLYVMDLETGESTLIRNEADAHLGGVDGLYFYKGDLVGIQNGTTPQRIVRVKLSKDGLIVRKLKVLAQALPEWSEPTHGTISGKEFIYIATSNWPAYDESAEWEVREGAELRPLRIMSVRLD